MRLAAIVLVLACAPASANVLEHTDLPGLVLQSDAVVVAERHASTYHVVQTLRTNRALPDQLVLADDGYHIPGDGTVVVFLAWDTTTPRIVPSGLRVVQDGKIFRFEQHDNPGGYIMVPDVHADLAALERAIDRAGRRVNRLALAALERDPMRRRARVVATIPAVAEEDGFNYADMFARRAAKLLYDTGDLEGALLVELRDHDHGFRLDYARERLLEIAHDPWAADDARIAAATALANRADNFLYATDMFALLDDKVPGVRTAAAGAALYQELAVNPVPNARAKLATRYRKETDPRVLYAIADSYANAKWPLPPHPSKLALATHVELYGETIAVDAYCLHSSTHAVKLSAVAFGAGHITAFDLPCKTRGEKVSAQAKLELTEATYELSLELANKKDVALGKLHVTSSGRTLD